MKKEIAAFCALLLVLGLAGCGAQPASSAAVSAPEAALASPEPSEKALAPSSPSPAGSAPSAATGVPESNSGSASPEGTGASDLYFTLNGNLLDTQTLEKTSNGSGAHDSDGDGVKEQIGFSLLIELTGKRPEQLADTGTIEFIDGTTVTKSVEDLVASVVVFKSNDGSINDKWGDYNIRFRFICNDVPTPYVKSITWAAK